MLGGGDHQKEQISGANAPQAPADGDVACDPGMQGASGHSNSRPWRDVLYDYSVGAICWRFDLNFALMSIL